MKHPVFDSSWSEEVKALYAHDMREMWDRSIAPHVWNQYHNQIDLYTSYAEGHKLRILDVGCAQATLALLLAERGHEVVAVDLREDFLKYAKTRYEHGQISFIRADVLNDEIEGHFDLVFANQIVEHLVYPGRLLSALKRRLNDGGRLVMTTPNADYFRSRLPTFSQLGDAADFEHLQNSADGDGHFYAYTAEELVREFVAAGFSDVTHRFFETPVISGHVKLRYLHGWLPSPILSGSERFLEKFPSICRRFGHQLLVTAVHREHLT
jgi:2-polyprenyl-3-methyl-5-hydroxy-6-metoxy-1,4-benzoquinol methylase